MNIEKNTNHTVEIRKLYIGQEKQQGEGAHKRVFIYDSEGNTVGELYIQENWEGNKRLIENAKDAVTQLKDCVNRLESIDLRLLEAMGRKKECELGEVSRGKRLLGQIGGQI